MLEHALGYAARGWRVIPLHNIVNGRCSCGKDCSSPGKHPRTMNGLKGASRAEKQIREWWGKWTHANIGVATGAFSGVVVLDIDGTAGHEAIKANGWEIPDTLTCNTGKGQHYYFNHSRIELRNFAGKLPKVDLRGEGGYVVAPPSNHISGATYHWEDESEDVEEIPDWLVELARAKRTAEKRKNGEPIVEGSRNDSLFRIACKHRGNGFSTDEIYDLILGVNARECSPPLEDDEVRKIAESAGKFDSNLVGLGDVPDHLKDGVIETLQSAGIPDTTISKVSRDFDKAVQRKAEDASIETIGLELVRRTAGPGLSSVYDAVITAGGYSVPLERVHPDILMSYDKVRVAALGEGVLLPSGTNSRKVWQTVLRSALESTRVVVEERDAQDDPVTACMEFISEWIESLHEADLNKVPTVECKAVVDGFYVFSGKFLRKHIKHSIRDARRGDVTRAMERLGIVDFQPTIDGKRPKLKRVLHPEHL